MIEQNVRISSKGKQVRGKFDSFKDLVDAAGEKLGAGVSYMTAYMRVYHGWNLNDAIKTPTRKYTKQAA